MVAFHLPGQRPPCDQRPAALGSGWWVGKRLRSLCFSFFPFLLSGGPLTSPRAHSCHLGGACTCAWSFPSGLLGMRPGESPSGQVSVAVPRCAPWTWGCFPGLCSGTGRGPRLLQQMTEALVSVDFIITARRSSWVCRTIVRKQFELLNVTPEETQNASSCA